MIRRTISTFGILLSLAAGCTGQAQPSVAQDHLPLRGPAQQTSPSPRPATVTTTATTAPVVDLARYSPPPVATAAHLRDIEPAVLDLASRAEAADVAYFSHHMGRAGAHLVHLMIERVNASDIPHTWREHLLGDRLNYHPTTHVQVELKLESGKWVVGGIWFCR